MSTTASSSPCPLQSPSALIGAPRRCRHCTGSSLDETITYSSVLVAGTVLRKTVESIEERIIPCVTAVCPECDRVSLISDGSTESILCSIFMWQRLRQWIDVGGETAALEAKVKAEAAGNDGVAEDGSADVIARIKAEDEDEDEDEGEEKACDAREDSPPAEEGVALLSMGGALSAFRPAKLRRL